MLSDDEEDNNLMWWDWTQYGNTVSNHVTHPSYFAPHCMKLLGKLTIWHAVRSLSLSRSSQTQKLYWNSFKACLFTCFKTIKKKCVAAYLRDASCHVIFVCRSTPVATTNKIKMLSSGSNHVTQTPHKLFFNHMSD